MPACMKQVGSSGEDFRLPENLSSEQVSPQPGEGRRRRATKISSASLYLKGTGGLEMMNSSDLTGRWRSHGTKHRL
jgi:hypothetical protein